MPRAVGRTIQALATAFRWTVSRCCGRRSPESMRPLAVLPARARNQPQAKRAHTGPPQNDVMVTLLSVAAAAGPPQDSSPTQSRPSTTKVDDEKHRRMAIRTQVVVVM